MPRRSASTPHRRRLLDRLNSGYVQYGQPDNQDRMHMDNQPAKRPHMKLKTATIYAISSLIVIGAFLSFFIFLPDLQGKLPGPSINESEAPEYLNELDLGNTPRPDGTPTSTPEVTPSATGSVPGGQGTPQAGATATAPPQTPNYASSTYATTMYQRVMGRNPDVSAASLPSSSLGWQTLSNATGSCSVTNGEYVASVQPTASQTCSATSSNYPDVAIQVTGTFLTESPYRGWGISYRRNGNYHQSLRIGNDGYYRVTDGGVTGAYNKPLTGPCSIQKQVNQSNILTVIALQDHHWYWVNGVYVGYYQKANTQGGGTLGVTITSGENTGLSVRYNNLKVWNLNGQPL